MINDDGLVTQRVWKTRAGEFVPEGHVDAAFLAYGVGDQVGPLDRDAVKALGKPADKARSTPPANKGRTA